MINLLSRLSNEIVKQRTEYRKEDHCNDPQNLLFSALFAFHDIDDHYDVDNQDNY